jgi:hypothetical protein
MQNFAQSRRIIVKTKVLTVKQPWATAILELGKDIENRSWYTNHRGELLIHSSKSLSRKEINKFLEIIPEYPLKEILSDSNFQCGCILGSVQLIEIVRDSSSKWAIPRQNHWVLSEPKVFDTPIPVKGQLGLWEYDLMPLFRQN